MTNRTTLTLCAMAGVAGAAAADETVSRREALTSVLAETGSGASATAAGLHAQPSLPRAASVGAIDAGGAFGAVSRWSAGAIVGDGALPGPGTMLEDFECLPCDQPPAGTCPQWGGAWSGFGGLNVYAAQTPGWAAGSLSVHCDPIGGNGSKKLRAQVVSGQGSPSPFFGRVMRYDLMKSNSPNVRLQVSPLPGANARMGHETYVTSISSLWTSEPTYTSSGFIIGRLLWGGANATTGIGLPMGPVEHFYTLGINPNAFLTGMFFGCVTPATYRSGAPFPGGAGHPVPVPVNQWFKIIHETTVDGTLLHVLDLLDGPGEFVIYEDPSIVSAGRFDRLAMSGDQSVTGDALYIDNLLVEGVEFLPPTPQPLQCQSGGFTDDMQWLFYGALIGQTSHWVDFLSSRGFVQDDPAAAGDKVICRENWAPDNRYRKQIHRLLPTTAALPTPMGAWTLCMDVSLPAPASGPYLTVQGIAPTSVTDGNFVTRLLLGRFDPGGSPQFSSNIFVQINPDYSPIDDESTPDPFLPGPGGNGGVPHVGIDLVDTGVAWPYGGFHEVCFEVANDRAMTISLDGVPIFTGQAFVNSLDRIDFESENNALGFGNEFCVDNIALDCPEELPPVILPPLTLPYLDDLEWCTPGISIGLHDDDNNPNTPFRWAAAANMLCVTVMGPNGPTIALRMENLFRDTPPSLPSLPPNPSGPTGFFQFTQASTIVPSVTASSTRGWVVGADHLLTDTETSRTWSAAQATPTPTLFARVTGITFSSVSDTFWFQAMNTGTPDPDDTTWVDTGASLATFGLTVNQWFQLTMHRALSGQVHFRINGAPLRYVGGAQSGQVVLVDGLTSTSFGAHKDLARWFYFGSDEDTAPVGSILYTDNIRAWSLPCPGETSGDGIVNFADLNNVLASFGQSAPGGHVVGNVAPDANNDGLPDDDAVNFADLNAVLGGFGIPCGAQN